jgi:hypothetical protein
MELASPQWMDAFKARCNASEDFRVASQFADTKLVFMFGDRRYYLKLYRGAIIDLQPFVMSFDPLGYDVVVRGPMDAWKSVAGRHTKFWDHYNNFQIEIGGNHMDAHRLHEALLVMCQDILPTV